MKQMLGFYTFDVTSNSFTAIIENGHNWLLKVNHSLFFYPEKL